MARFNITKQFKTDLWIAAAIFALALAVRLIFIYELLKSPTFLAPIMDAGTYDGLARRLAEGKEMNSQFFWQGLFYPFFLSRIYFFAGNSVIWAKLVQVFLASGLSVLVYRLGIIILDRRTGILAAIFTALYGPLIFFETRLLATGWAAIWSVLLILLFLKAREKKSLWIYFTLGICGATSILTRPTFLPFFLATLIWLVLALRRSSINWKTVAEKQGLVLVGFMLIVGPVALLCFRTTSRLSMLPKSGAVNFYIGNNPDAEQTIKIRPGPDWEDLNLLPRRHGADNHPQTERFFMSRFWHFVATQPLNFLMGLAQKSIQFISSREIPRNIDMYAARKYSYLFSGLTWKADRFGFPFGLILPLAIIGLIHRRSSIPVPVILFLILYPAAIILVFVTARYRTPMIPVISVLAATGFWSIVETIKTRCWRRAIVMVGIAAITIPISIIPGPFPAETVNYDAEMQCCLASIDQQQDRLDLAADHLYEALSLQPRYSYAHRNLAIILYQQNKTEEAIEHLEKALKINPSYHSARFKLASILSKQQRFEEAVEHFYKDLEINPKLADTHYNLALNLFKLGKKDQALPHLREGLSCAEAANNQALAAKIKNAIARTENTSD